jgi:beta-galactosidase GanA
VPIYWEQIEPQENQFTFSLVDTLLLQARQHNKKLVLLWFATYKNGSNHYMPGWMKQDARNYPNIVNAKGDPIDSPSPNTTATMEADTKAFKAVMKHLKATDPQHTVIMVQLENESGSWGSVRDYSPHIQKLIDAPVPAELLKPEIQKALHANQATQGSWKQVFGDRADEYFQAWSIASFIGRVAAAGKAAYPLPVYVNAALREPLTNPMANQLRKRRPDRQYTPDLESGRPRYRSGGA